MDMFIFMRLISFKLVIERYKEKYGILRRCWRLALIVFKLAREKLC